MAWMAASPAACESKACKIDRLSGPTLVQQKQYGGETHNNASACCASAAGTASTKIHARTQRPTPSQQDSAPSSLPLLWPSSCHHVSSAFVLSKCRLFPTPSLCMLHQRIPQEPNVLLCSGRCHDVTAQLRCRGGFPQFASTSAADFAWHWS